MKKAGKWLLVAIVSSVIGFISIFVWGMQGLASTGAGIGGGAGLSQDFYDGALIVSILCGVVAFHSSIYSLILTWGKSDPTKKVSKSDRVLMTIFNPIVFLIGCVCYFAIIITFNLD